MEKNNLLIYLIISLLCLVSFYLFNQNKKLKKQIFNQKRLEEDALTRVKYENELNKEINELKELEIETRKIEMDKILKLTNEKKILAKKLEIERRRRYYINGY